VRPDDRTALSAADTAAALSRAGDRRSPDTDRPPRLGRSGRQPPRAGSAAAGRTLVPDRVSGRPVSTADTLLQPVDTSRPSARWGDSDHDQGDGRRQRLDPASVPGQRRLTSTSQTSDSLPGGPSRSRSTQVTTTVPWRQSAYPSR
jgi:hypothetical protein